MLLLKMKEQLVPERIILHSPRGPLSHISLVPTDEQGHVRAVNIVQENKKSTAASKTQRDQQFEKIVPICDCLIPCLMSPLTCKTGVAF